MTFFNLVPVLIVDVIFFQRLLVLLVLVQYEIFEHIWSDFAKF